MRGVIPNLRNRQVIGRMLVDFTIVHLAAIASLVCVLLWQLVLNPDTEGTKLALALGTIYETRFAPLSLLFPIVFMLSGFYSYARSYTKAFKWRTIAWGSAAATLVYLFADFLITRADIIPRSSTLLFLFFVGFGTIGVRWLHCWFIDNAKPKTSEESNSDRQAPVLVVGGAGYIGSLLCRRLLDTGRRVRVLDSLVYGDASIRDLLGRPDFELIIGDCRNIQNVVGAVKGVESIVHLAAIVGDPACDQDRQTALEVNYAATRMLIEIARGNGIARFVFASSCSVYGASDELMTEKSALAPISLYARTKVDSERALLESRSATFHPTILRLATVFGHSYRPRFDLLVNLLAAKAFNEGVITIFNGQQWRPFIHVTDVAEGIATILTAPINVVSGETFNLGDTRLNLTLAAVAEKIQESFPNTTVEHVENTDRRNYRVSCDKVRNYVGFTCTTTLEDGILELRTAFERGLIDDYRSLRYHNQKLLQSRGSPRNANVVDAGIMAAFGAYEPPLSKTAAGD
jgi:nucleoside-diphosphate-sugar epimerase